MQIWIVTINGLSLHVSAEEICVKLWNKHISEPKSI